MSTFEFGPLTEAATCDELGVMTCWFVSRAASLVLSVSTHDCRAQVFRQCHTITVVKHVDFKHMNMLLLCLFAYSQNKS